MTDFVPGGDFIPGSDFIPGVTDVLGIDWAPGIDSGADIWGTDWAPGIDQAGPDQTGWGNDWIPQGYDIPILQGSGKGNKKSASSGQTQQTSQANQGSSISPMVNLTADVLGGNGAPMFDFSPDMGSTPMSNTTQTAPQMHFAEGGHVPEFFSEGGMRHVKGDGDGTSDSVPALLATGEFVIPADVVASLGNGDNDSGSNILDSFISSIRQHKQEHSPEDLPPDSKGALAYLQEAKNKVKA